MTTHQLFIRHSAALGIDSYNTFCKLLELLAVDCRVEVLACGAWTRTAFAPHNNSLSEAILGVIEHRQATHAYRIVLLNGTVIREWPVDEYDGIF